MTQTNAAAAATTSTPINPERLRTSAERLVVDSVTWLESHWLQILIAVGIASLIVVALLVVRGWARRYCERDQKMLGWGKVLGRVVSRTGRFFIVMVAAKIVSGYAYAPDAVARTIDFLFTVAAVFQAAIWARELILGVIERRTESETYTHESLASAIGIIRLLVTVALFAIALIVVLDNLGVNVTGLVAGLGVGGIAIGLAAQGIFADLFAALSIIFDKPFRRGDAVTLDTTSGSIEAIGLKSTRIRALTGEEVVIANKNLLDKQIGNNTLRTHRRQKWTLGLIYQTPADRCAAVPGLLREVVEAEGGVFVRAGFVGFGASSLDFELEFDTPGADFDSFYAARSAIGLAILRRFNDEGLDFAYPTQTTFTAAPDGTMVLPYASVQPVKDISAEGA
ncbi:MULTISPECIES: mechanosensitive ion channel family protein [unclassified Sphingomonas]|uniref:mechanosensitive ion channel family protein n=1 Tax=unclassified Sphingomonas TaxID=196159 RepID=UPI0008377CEE|nr:MULTISPECIES: mechanosensitive ion channel family protein [unclassified Sphingomonas]MCH4891703.1 mechanosensitive ion channel [Sphingomonas sp. SFZ2018-12]